MTTETQILQELVDAVESLNSPDLLSVGATVLAAVAAAVITYVLGKRQNKLQEQQLKLQERQTKAQEYEVYKRLYILINKINLQIENLIFTVFTFYIPERDSQSNPFLEYIDNASDLFDEFTQNIVDFELKFPNEKVILKNYQLMLMDMVGVFKMFQSMLTQEKQLRQTITLDEKTSLDCLIGDDAQRVEVLLSHIPHEGRKVSMTYNLQGFLEKKDIILKHDFIGIIANRCKID